MKNLSEDIHSVLSDIHTYSFNTNYFLPTTPGLMWIGCTPHTQMHFDVCYISLTNYAPLRSLQGLSKWMRVGKNRPDLDSLRSTFSFSSKEAVEFRAALCGFPANMNKL